MKVHILKIIFAALFFSVMSLGMMTNVQAEGISLKDNIDAALSADVNIGVIETDGDNVRISAPKDEDEQVNEIKTLTGDPLIEEMIRRIIDKKVKINLQQINSLFFTVWEGNLLSDARKGFVTRPATDSEITQSASAAAKAEGVALSRGRREISVGGIVYISSKNWIVWLNGQKITPKRIPVEILDIQVQKDYIKLKWFDAYTNKVFPIKLRTHQRFNIDTRIFLPG